MSRPSILVTRQWPSAALGQLRMRYDVTVDSADMPLGKADFLNAMTQFDAICPTVTDRLDKEILAVPGARVRILANYGVGVDHIDLSAAVDAGIVVTNTPDVLTVATAELAVLLMLMTSRRAGEGERELRSGAWTGWRPTHMVGSSLRDKTLGLVGFGRIAQETARIASAAFGMQIAYHSRRPVASSDHEYYADLDSLISGADVLSLHCPGGSATHHLIDARRLALMKPSALLINTARGTIIDEHALVKALRMGRLAGAGLDVFEKEPRVLPDLLSMENAVLLPHLGSATLETRTSMGLRVGENLDQFFAGQTPRDTLI